MNKMQAGKLTRYLVLVVMLLLNVFLLNAQFTDLVDSTQKHVLPDSSKKYLMPDLQRDKTPWTQFGNKWITAQLGFAPIIDYTSFVQDNDSKTQVGEQENKAELRSGRFSVRGKFLFKNPWTYFLTLEYKGLDRAPEENAFGMTDISIGIPIKKFATFTVGKIKETFSYEMIGDAANLPQLERILSPFFVSRNTGIKLNGTVADDRMSWHAGYYNNWLLKDVSFGDAANTFTARVTGLPVYKEKSVFIHMGLAARYVTAEKGNIRLRGRNESNVSDYYVDTKDFPANHEFNLGLEQLWSVHNISLLGEVIHSWVNTPTGNEQFSGMYILASWVISGEQRPYDKKAGYARRILPDGKGGAWELFGRYSKVNLTTRNIEGGNLNKYTFGLNWWATQYWKAGFAYGISNLDKSNMLGITNSFQFRIQWIY